MKTLYYQIKPLHKNSIAAFYDVYDGNEDRGDARGFKISESWEFGVGFRDHPLSKNEIDNEQVLCDDGEQKGQERGVEFEWTGRFDEGEQNSIRESWDRFGSDWLYGVIDGGATHSWKVANDWVTIVGPVEVKEITEDDGLDFQPTDSEEGA
jgi:hypothetical protein